MGVWRSDTARGARAAAGEPAASAPALARLRALAAAGVILLLALLPRTVGLADYFTTDEAYHWITRTERFSAALAAGRWADTALTGHPGVTNMWLGSLGLALERALVAAGLAPQPTALAHLAWLRLPGAVLQSLLVPAAYLLLRRLVDSRAALAAAAMWALSPYLIAHSRLLHLDALLTSFVTFSVLLLLLDRQTAEDGRPQARGRGQAADGAQPPAFGAGRFAGRWPLVASGIFAGLALLTKGPALILLAFVGLLDAWDWASAWRAGRPPLRSLLAVAGSRLAWLGAALLSVVALWPALWADPGRALGTYIGEIVSNGGRPNGDGQFFLGRAVADPGPLFYPLADLFRATPLMTAGLAAYAAFGMLDAGLRRRGRASDPVSAARNPALLALLALVVFWTLAMTAGPKKFDRYVLPTWPALIVLSAAGLARGADAATAALQVLRPRARRVALGGVLAAAAALELAQPLGVQPHYLSYYNPLLGGGPAAERTFLIGWGEGMEQAGAWLSAQPDIGYGPVLSALGRTLQPFVPVDVRDVEDFGRVPANYAVVYLESVQRAANPPLYAALQRTAPLHRVVINGIEYARIYQLPRPFATPLDARFGEALALRGVTLEQAAGRITVTPAWDVLAPPGADYMVFVHLLDGAGRQVARLDVPPGGGDAPATSAWAAGRQIAVPLPLDLPPELPPGSYRLTMGVYDAASGARLPLAGGPRADPAAAGGEALLLATLQLPANK